MNYSIILYTLGQVLRFEGYFMALPLLVSFIYGESIGTAYALVGTVCIVIGLILSRKNPKEQMFFAKEGFVTVALSWIVLSVFGCLPFIINGEIPSFTDALFETISGFTTTGASVLSNVEALSYCNLFWRSFTHWIGGMGIFVFLLAVLPLAGGLNMHFMKAESPGPSVGKLVPRVRETAFILYAIYFVLTVMEIIFLLIAGMPLFDAVASSLATAGTGGFGIKNDSIGGYSRVIQNIITIFMILFGINFNAYFFIIKKKIGAAFKMEEVRAYLGIIAATILVITLNIHELFPNPFVAFQQASFQVASIITTTGFSTYDFNLWPQLSKSLLILIMMIGACAGSTGGGIKVSRIIILCKTVVKDIRQFINPRSVQAIKMDGKTVEDEIIRGVSVFLVTYLLIFIASVFLLAFDNFDFVTSFTAVAATLNNIGPGLELVGPTHNFGFFSGFSKYVLMFDMLAGRLELYPMLLLFAPSVWRKKAFRTPRNHYSKRLL